MSKQLKLLPAFIMLLAGALTSILTFYSGYDTKDALVILLIVLIVFYILGAILQRLIFKFEEANKPEEKEEAVEATDEEGTVVEKGESDIKSTETAGGGVGNRPPIEKEE